RDGAALVAFRIGEGEELAQRERAITSVVRFDVSRTRGSGIYRATVAQEVRKARGYLRWGAGPGTSGSCTAASSGCSWSPPLERRSSCPWSAGRSAERSD